VDAMAGGGFGGSWLPEQLDPLRCGSPPSRRPLKVTMLADWVIKSTGLFNEMTKGKHAAVCPL